MKKYMVYPGWIPSANDGDMHYISSQDLIRLYGVNRNECIIVPTGKCYENSDHMFYPLRPHRMGDYSLPDHVA